MSVDTGDGDRLPVTTAARPLTGGSGCVIKTVNVPPH